MVGRIKVPVKCCKNRSNSPLPGDSLPKMENFDILRQSSHPGHRLAWNFARPSGPRFAVPDFTWIGATGSPMHGECWFFWPVTKSNTGSLPFRGILLVTRKANYYNDCLSVGTLSGKWHYNTGDVPAHWSHRRIRQWCHKYTVCKYKYKYKYLGGKYKYKYN